MHTMLRNTPNESTARTGIRRYFSTINNVTGRNSKSAQRIRELLQRSQLQEKENEERYGDEYGPKPPQTLRCMSKNICNAPAEPYKEKSRKIVKSIKLSESDVIGIQEPGLNVRHLDESETWAARTYRVLNKARTLMIVVKVEHGVPLRVSLQIFILWEQLECHQASGTIATSSVVTLQGEPLCIGIVNVYMLSFLGVVKNPKCSL